MLLKPSRMRSRACCRRAAGVVLAADESQVIEDPAAEEQLDKGDELAAEQQQDEEVDHAAEGQHDEDVDHAAEEQQEEGDDLVLDQQEELTVLLKSSR